MSLAEILADLAEFGITPSPLAVISRAVDLGLAEDRVVELAAEMRERLQA